MAAKQKYFMFTVQADGSLTFRSKYSKRRTAYSWQSVLRTQGVNVTVVDITKSPHMAKYVPNEQRLPEHQDKSEGRR